MYSQEEILTRIKHRILSSNQILIIISRPIDPDCVGTALALKWWLGQHDKKTDIVSFTRLTQNMSTFPAINSISYMPPETFNFNPYQCIILVDGSSWEQFLGEGWEKILSKIDIEKIVNLDHHIPGEIKNKLPSSCLNIKTSSTAQLLNTFFIKPYCRKPPPDIAHILYLALLYDSRMFKNEAYQDMYKFADDMLTLGADHLKAVDTNYDLQEINFIARAIDKTEFIPSLQLTLLLIDSSLNLEFKKELGENWSDFDGPYKETIQRQIKGYNYGIILTDNMDGTIRLGWRTRNYGSTLAIADVARQAGFIAGGHRNAGGGSFTGSIETARHELLDAMDKSLKSLNPGLK